jgi:hypothetical protein
MSREEFVMSEIRCKKATPCDRLFKTENGQATHILCEPVEVDVKVDVKPEATNDVELTKVLVEYFVKDGRKPTAAKMRAFNVLNGKVKWPKALVTLLPEDDGAAANHELTANRTRARSVRQTTGDVDPASMPATWFTNKLGKIVNVTSQVSRQDAIDEFETLAGTWGRNGHKVQLVELA